MATSLQQLQSLLEFDDEDLKANRKGRLSAAQIEDLRRQSKQELKMVLLIPVMAVMWMLVALEMAVALPGVMLIGLICSIVSIIHNEQFYATINRTVDVISGPLQKQPVRNYFGPAQCIIAIGDEQLAIDRELFDKLTEGKFTIYMLDRQILCMEPFKRPSAKKKAPPAKKSTSTTKAARASASRTTTAGKTRSASTTGAKSTTTRSSSSKSKSTSMKKSAMTQAKSKRTSSTAQKRKTTTASTQPGMAKPAGNVRAKPPVRTRKSS